jgi:hypothetical protein
VTLGDRVAPASAGTAGARTKARPEWVRESDLLEHAWEIAQEAHRSQTRASDGRPFLTHVVEVASLLHDAGFDEELVAVGLLHDSVERGALSEEELRGEVPERIADQVMTLSEDPAIDSFDERKAALRAQVAAAGGRAMTVFAADKLSDILGLRRGIHTYGDGIEDRIGTSIGSMARHYRESVDVIAAARPGSAFLPALRLELDHLGDESAPGA